MKHDPQFFDLRTSQKYNLYAHFLILLSEPYIISLEIETFSKKSLLFFMFFFPFEAKLVNQIKFY